MRRLLAARPKTRFFRAFILLLAAFLTGCRVIFITPPASQPLPGTQNPPSDLIHTLTTPAPDLTPASPTHTPEPSPTLDVAALSGQTVTLAHPWLDDQSQAFNTLVQAFNSANPYNLIIQPVPYGGCQAMQDAFESSGVSQDAAICFTSNLLTPALTPSWSTLLATASGVLDQPSTFYDAATPLGALGASIATAKGQQVLPLAFNPGLLFYNQTWATELGFATLPLTPDDLRQQMDAGLNALLADDDWNNNGTGGLLLSKTPLSALSWYVAAGSAPTVRDNLPVFDHATLQTAFTFLKSLYTEDDSWVGSQGTPWQYFSRRYALAYEGSLTDLTMQETVSAHAGSPDTWLTLPYPTQDGVGSLAVETLGFAVSTPDPARQAAAWLFARWLLSPESQEVFVAVHGLWPAAGSPASLVPTYLAQHPAYATALSSDARLSTAPEGANWSVSRLLLQDAFQRLYGLDEAYFPQVFDMLDSLLKEMGGSGG